MDRRKGIIAGVVMVGLIVLLVYLFSGESEKEKALRRKFISDKWEREFVLDSKDPLGLALFKQLAESQADSSAVLKDSFPVAPDSMSTYVFAGDKFSLYQQEFTNILANVAAGSDLFLSYHELTENIREQFFHDIYIQWHFEEEVTVYNDKQSFDLYSVYQTDTVARVWNLIRPENVIDTNYTVVSAMMETPNFIKLKLGKGFIYLHTNPELFYNYQLLSKDGFRHAQFVIGTFRKGHAVKWLELGRLRDDFGNSDTEVMEGQDGREDNSLLLLLFSHKELLVALLLVILGILLYLIFRTKRYWPVIPYLPKSKNRSLDFADTMTAVYFNQQSPYSILIVMRKNFRANISRHFFLDISKSDNAREIRLLSEKSGVEISQLEILVTMLENVKMQAVTYEYIQDVARRQRQFYLKTGIIKDKVRVKSEKKKIEFKRQIAIPSTLIFIGINGIIRGFYLLAKSESTGIIFWPLGLLCLLVGIYLFNRKLIVVDKNQLTWYLAFGRKQVFSLGDVMDVKVTKGFTIIQFTGKRTLKVNHFEISYYSRKDFERFISPYIKLL